MGAKYNSLDELKKKKSNYEGGNQGYGKPSSL